jgi:hypothetical protein
LDNYHDTHYRLFHTLLPGWLRGELFSPFIDAVVKGDGGSFLVGLWRGVAKKVSGTANLKSPLNLTRDDFSTQLIQPADGKAIIFIHTPAVDGPLEAAFVAVYFEEQDPIGTLRYFTCEAPAEEFAPWFIGEWRGSAHSNLGGLMEGDAFAFYERILSVLGIESEEEPPSEVMNSQLSGECSWTSDPSELADYSFARLLGIREQGGSVFIMNAPKTRGLSGEASSYVQFMWHDEGDLVVEIQGDYSYFGLSIASNRWPILQEAGMQTPVAGAGNFVQVIPASYSHEQFRSRLAQVFRAFIVVLAPVGDIVEASF